jgi:hypothetical protein
MNHCLFGYVGPETTLPIASAIAAALGFLLTFWRSIWGAIRKGFAALFGARTTPGPWRQKPDDTA